MINPDFSEKRNYLRFPVRIPTSYFLEELNRTIHASTDNISAEGLCLLSDRELPTGLSVNIYIEMLDNKERIFRKGTVVWNQLTAEGKYRAGIKLEENIKPIPMVLRTITSRDN